MKNPSATPANIAIIAINITQPIPIVMTSLPPSNHLSLSIVNISKDYNRCKEKAIK